MYQIEIKSLIRTKQNLVAKVLYILYKQIQPVEFAKYPISFIFDNTYKYCAK